MARRLAVSLPLRERADQHVSLPPGGQGGGNKVKNKIMPRIKPKILISASAGTLAAILFLALLTGCGGEKATTAAQDNGGRLSLPETYYDFDQVPITEKVEHGFEIINSGAGPLQLGAMNVERLEGC